MLDSKFDCGWCESTKECSMESRCGQQETWLNGEDGLCPDPTVSSVGCLFVGSGVCLFVICLFVCP